MEIVLIIGLPGSGKSTLIRTEYSNNTDYVVFDDVKSHAVLDCGDFTYSRYYPNIVDEMRKGLRNIVISDISFCRYEQFSQVRQILNWWIETYQMDYRIKSIIFRNEPERCIENIIHDENRNNQRRIEMIRQLSQSFSPEEMKITNDDIIRPVYSERVV